MEHKIRENMDRRWTIGHAAAALAIFVFFMLCPAAPETWSNLYSFFGKTIIIAFIAVFFYVRRLSCGAELNLVLIYALWLLVTRMLNADPYLQKESDLVICKFLCVPIMAAPLLLDTEGRRRFLNVFAAIVVVFYSAAAILALIANLYGTQIYLPPENVLFGLEKFDYIIFLNAFNTNRTISSLWFYIAWCMSVYLFLSCRRKLWRIPAAICFVILYIAIAMCFARTVMLITSVSAAMLAMLLAFRYLPSSKVWQKLLIIVLCIAIFTPLIFKSFDGIASVMSNVSVSLAQSDNNEQADSNVNEGLEFTDPRDLKEDISTLSLRSTIYASFLPTLHDDPGRIWNGSLSSELMEIPNGYIRFVVPFRHMHNFLLETFMLTGLPGFLIVCLFCLLLVIRMLHMFFCSSSLVSLSQKFLTIPITGMLLYGMFEVFIFTVGSDLRAPTDIRELSFFILSGALLGCSKAVLPSLRRLR